MVWNTPLMHCACATRFGPMTSRFLVAQAISRCNKEHISAVISKRRARFADAVRSVLLYVRTFREDHGVSLVDLCRFEVVEVMVSSHLLASSSREAYICNMRARKMTVKLQNELYIF